MLPQLWAWCRVSLRGSHTTVVQRVMAPGWSRYPISRVSLSCDLVESGEIRNVNRKRTAKLPERCEVGIR